MNLPDWELIDIYNYINTQMQVEEEERRNVTIKTFAIDTTEETHYDYEISEFNFYAGDTLNEFTDNIIRKAEPLKEYKTVKGFAKRCAKEYKEAGNNEYVRIYEG